MTIDYDALLNWPFPEVEQTYTEKDTILYALGVGPLSYTHLTLPTILLL